MKTTITNQPLILFFSLLANHSYRVYSIQTRAQTDKTVDITKAIQKFHKSLSDWFPIFKKLHIVHFILRSITKIINNILHQIPEFKILTTELETNNFVMLSFRV